MCEKRCCSQGLLARTHYTGFWGFCPGRSATRLTESFCSDELNSHDWVLIKPLLLPLPRVNCQSLICSILSDWLSITTGWHESHQITQSPAPFLLHCRILQSECPDALAAFTIWVQTVILRRIHLCTLLSDICFRCRRLTRFHLVFLCCVRCLILAGVTK